MWRCFLTTSDIDQDSFDIWWKLMFSSYYQSTLHMSLPFFSLGFIINEINYDFMGTSSQSRPKSEQSRWHETWSDMTWGMVNRGKSGTLKIVYCWNLVLQDTIIISSSQNTLFRSLDAVALDYWRKTQITPESIKSWHHEINQEKNSIWSQAVWWRFSKKDLYHLTFLWWIIV